MSLFDELGTDEFNEKEFDGDYRKVALDKIIPNEKNIYEISNIESLASDIEKHGQQDNGLAYIVNEDGTEKFKLIGGERRFRAIKLLDELGLKDPDGEDWKYLLKVVPEPENDDEENLLILSNNIQREKTKEERNREILLLSRLYISIKQSDKRFDDAYYGGINVRDKEKKREYIARILHISERTVQDVLSDDRRASELVQNGMSPKEAEETVNENRKNPNNMTSSEWEYLQRLQENLSDTFGVRIKINKKLKMTFSFESVDDIARFVSDIGCNDDGNIAY
jgi:hypothetical protein